ncbi:hypothetical protein BpHYR1_003550 [Brachionus plicatilis]|uniref:Uncharacterized protein n=1 Tax=Brachionus plicatilis TaxID=10195 RepID=A0A3M7QD61_BRAPC|nr:hypothetical protein BpHYR1_003550 [Brachionus plicatilis]
MGNEIQLRIREFFALQDVFISLSINLRKNIVLIDWQPDDVLFVQEIDEIFIGTDYSTHFCHLGWTQKQFLQLKLFSEHHYKQALLLDPFQLVFLREN